MNHSIVVEKGRIQCDKDVNNQGVIELHGKCKRTMQKMVMNRRQNKEATGWKKKQDNS